MEEDYQDDIPPMPEDDEEEQEDTPRGRIRHYKAEAVMRQECHDYVMAGKRLPKMHSMWIHNRYENTLSALHALETAHRHTEYLLDEARQEIVRLNASQEEEERDQRAMEEEERDMYTIKKEWYDYAHKGDETPPKAGDLFP